MASPMLQDWKWVHLVPVHLPPLETVLKNILWCWVMMLIIKFHSAEGAIKKHTLKTCKTKSKSKTKHPPTRSLLGPTSIEFQFQEYLDGHRQNPSWCLVVRTTYLCTGGKVTSNILWNSWTNSNRLSSNWIFLLTAFSNAKTVDYIFNYQKLSVS